MSTRLPPTLLAVAGLASQIKFRTRETTLALEGVLDAQILVELSIWAAVGAFVVWRLLDDSRWPGRRSPFGLGPGLRTYGVISAIALATTLGRASPFFIARATQLTIAIGLAVVVVRDISLGRTDVATLWRDLRRSIVGLVTILTLANIVVRGPSVGVPNLGQRFDLFYSHPIATGSVLSVAVLMVTGTVLGQRDPLVGRRGQVVATLLAIGLWSCLIATQARGALIATVTGTLILATTSPHRRRRGMAVLVAGLVAAVLVSGLVDDTLSAVVVRGQDRDQLLSLTGRTELFGYAWQLVQDRPILGYGYLAGRAMFLERFPWAGESHNAFLDVAISLGAIGIVLYGLVFVHLARQLAQVFRRVPARRPIIVELAALLVAILTIGVVSEGFTGAMSLEVAIFVAIVAIGDGLAIDARRAGQPEATQTVPAWPAATLSPMRR